MTHPYPPEPFRIKVIESIRLDFTRRARSRAQRVQAITSSR